MKIKLQLYITAILFASILLGCSDEIVAPKPIITENHQLIILKADDFIYDYQNVVTFHWVKFTDYIVSKNIKAGLGIIGSSINNGNSEFYSIVKILNMTGNFEFWNHGYTHALNATNGNGKMYHEFWNTTAEYQKDELLKTQNLAKEKLGIVMNTFGAPGNAVDTNTVKAINEISELHSWFFGLQDSSKLVLKRAVEIEFPTHYPDYQKFLDNYKSDEKYLVLQIHPNSWDEARFAEFEKIIDFLIEQDAQFITPTEYYNLVKK